jgi:uncharacterized protein YvpB
MKIKNLLILSLITCGILSSQAQTVNPNDIKIGLPISKPVPPPTSIVPKTISTSVQSASISINSPCEAMPLPTVIRKGVPLPVPGRNSTESITLSVKHQIQETMLCLPTSASMMLSKLGWNFHPRQIKLASLGKTWYGPSAPFNDYTGMTFMGLQTALQKLGQKGMCTTYSDQNFTIGLEDIKNSIRRGYPVIIGTTVQVYYGHAVLVIGFDEKNKRVVIDNPAYQAPGIVYYSYDDLKNKYWNNKFFGSTSRSVFFMKGAGIPYR